MDEAFRIERRLKALEERATYLERKISKLLRQQAESDRDAIHPHPRTEIPTVADRPRAASATSIAEPAHA
jgi:hypothetical protein